MLSIAEGRLYIKVKGVQARETVGKERSLSLG